jgi:hypothetical protein
MAMDNDQKYIQQDEYNHQHILMALAVSVEVIFDSFSKSPKDAKFTLLLSNLEHQLATWVRMWTCVEMSDSCHTRAPIHTLKLSDQVERWQVPPKKRTRIICGLSAVFYDVRPFLKESNH